MLTPDLMRTNQLFWRNAGSPSVKPLPPLEWEKTWGPTLDRTASARVDDAFGLLIAGQDEEACRYAVRAIELAGMALAAESFARKYTIRHRTVSHSPLVVEIDEDFEPSEFQKEAERLDGRRLCLAMLHHGIWFSTGRRPVELVRELLRWEQAACDLRDREYGPHDRSDQESLYPFLLLHVEGEDYEAAGDLYRRQYAKPLEGPPKNRRFLDNRAHVLYLLAEYLKGQRHLEPYARAGVEYWYALSLDWYHRDSRLSWWQERLSWAYLRGKHFTGVVELRPLLDELRGY